MLPLLTKKPILSKTFAKPRLAVRFRSQTSETQIRSHNSPRVIYVIQQDTQYLMINLLITFSSSTCFALQKSIFRSVLMLYVAIWYVSIRPVVMRVKECDICSVQSRTVKSFSRYTSVFPSAPYSFIYPAQTMYNSSN